MEGTDVLVPRAGLLSGDAFTFLYEVPEVKQGLMSFFMGRIFNSFQKTLKYTKIHHCGCTSRWGTCSLRAKSLLHNHCYFMLLPMDHFGALSGVWNVDLSQGYSFVLTVTGSQASFEGGSYGSWSDVEVDNDQVGRT